MEELIPLGSGLLLGCVLGLLRPSLRLPLGAVLAVVLGVMATVVTGESRISWSYVLIDIPLVAVSAVLGLLAGRRLAEVARRAT
jgi:xanthosine utilization system XapX-like protein